MNELEQKIIDTYKPSITTLRQVADICGTDHHRVKRVLIKNDIPVLKGIKKPVSDEHKAKISKATKGRTSWIKGKKATKEMLYKNMASHLRFDIDYQWLMQFDDIEKLKTLNRCITNRSGRFAVDTEWYKLYILKFWSCPKFNEIYKRWVNSNYEFLKQPSLDHIHPVCKGGDLDLNNLQFLSWFENRCKNHMAQDEWDLVKSKIHEYLI